MAHAWHAGVLKASSWHGLESVEALPDAATLIRRGEQTGAWPVAVRKMALQTSAEHAGDGLDGLEVPGGAVVATYADGHSVALSAVGKDYRPLSPAEWRATVEAAVAAGARPAGAFALYGGARVVATFEIPGGNDGTGLRNHLVIADSYDGSTAHVMGGTSIRVVCANTMSMFMREGGHAAVRHTSSVDEAAKALREQIEVHIRTGERVRDLYRKARAARISAFPKATIAGFLEALYPTPTDEQRRDKPALASKMIAAQDAFFRAMKRPENAEGDTLASLWNGATFLVDRDADGTARDVRGEGGRLGAMLFGERGKRIAKIQTMVERVLADGTVAATPFDDEKTITEPVTPPSVPPAAPGKLSLADFDLV